MNNNNNNNNNNNSSIVAIIVRASSNVQPQKSSDYISEKNIRAGLGTAAKYKDDNILNAIHLIFDLDHTDNGSNSNNFKNDDDNETFCDVTWSADGILSRYKKSCLPSTQQNGTKEEGGHVKQEGGGHLRQGGEGGHLRQEGEGGHLNGTKDLRQEEAGGGGKSLFSFDMWLFPKVEAAAAAGRMEWKQEGRDRRAVSPLAATRGGG